MEPVEKETGAEAGERDREVAPVEDRAEDTAAAGVPAAEADAQNQPGEDAQPEQSAAKAEADAQNQPGDESQPEQSAAEGGQPAAEADAQNQPGEDAQPEQSAAKAEADAQNQPGEEAQPEQSAAEGGQPAAEADAQNQPGDESQPEQSAPEGAVAGEGEVLSAELLVEDRGGEDDGGRAKLRAVIEAVIYVTDEPLSAQQIAAAIEQPVDVVTSVLDELASEYQKPERGLTIREVAGGYKMGTKPEHHEEIRRFVRNLKPPLKLSPAALETLAVIAYKQPITAPEILEIRGVQGAGVLKTLIDRKLIAPAGRKQVVGKPILYKTTREFLIQFGLKDLGELPTLKEFEELGRLALSEPEPEAAVAAAPGGSAPEAAPESGETIARDERAEVRLEVEPGEAAAEGGETVARDERAEVRLEVEGGE